MDPTSAPSNRPEFLSTAATSSSSSSSPPKQWRKVLWTSSGFPDNHVDSSFLEEMRRNISTPIYSWRRVFFDAEVVSRQLSCVSIFLAVFAFLFLEWASPKLVLGVAGVVSAVGFGVYRICVGGEDSSRDCASSSSSSATCSCDPVTPATPFTSPATSSATPLTHSACSATSYTSFTSSSTPSSSSIPSPTSSASPSLLSILQCFPYLALCYGLSPILITLTRTISEDTIYAMTALMLFAYLLFYDYRPSASMTSSPISLNAAIFASVCLASRLPSGRLLALRPGGQTNRVRCFSSVHLVLYYLLGKFCNSLYSVYIPVRLTRLPHQSFTLLPSSPWL